MRFPERRPRPAPVAPEVAEIPLGIRRAAAWSWRLLLIIAGCWVVLQGMSHIQVIVIPVLALWVIGPSALGELREHPFGALLLLVQTVLASESAR